MNKERLLNVAKALRESKNPKKFTMKIYGHDCGTPACAFGHYASRRDLQSEFALGATGWPYSLIHAKDVTCRDIGDHFDLCHSDLLKLFNAIDGCGGAKTAIEAAEYIEQFVRDRE